MVTNNRLSRGEFLDPTSEINSHHVTKIVETKQLIFDPDGMIKKKGWVGGIFVSLKVAYFKSGLNLKKKKEFGGGLFFLSKSCLLSNQA